MRTSGAPACAHISASAIVAHLKRVMPSAIGRWTSHPSLWVLTCGRSRVGPPAILSISARFRWIGSKPNKRAGERTFDKSTPLAHAISSVIAAILAASSRDSRADVYFAVLLECECPRILHAG